MNELLEARKKIYDRIIDTCNLPDDPLDRDFDEIWGRREGLQEAAKIIDDLVENIIGEMADYNGEA